MTPFARMLLGRLGGMLLTLFLASVAIFSALIMTPGDPVTTLAGGAKLTPELVAQIRTQYLLDEPLWVRYGDWLLGALQGDFGRSYVYKIDVAQLVGARFGITLQLVIFTVILILLFGVGSGILAATRGAIMDRATAIVTALGMALPTFVVAILLVWVFAKTLGWFPVQGVGGEGWSRVWHLTLPAISLSALYVAYISRVTRSSIVAQLHSEHVETARVRGIPRGKIFTRHVFRNASPQVLAISGITIAGLFGAAAIVEVAFGLGGIGSLLTEAAARKDLPTVQIVSLLLVAIFVVLNAASDIVSGLIDPDSVSSGARK